MKRQRVGEPGMLVTGDNFPSLTLRARLFPALPIKEGERGGHNAVPPKTSSRAPGVCGCRAHYSHIKKSRIMKLIKVFLLK